MQLGAVFPQAQIGLDSGAVREFVQGVEDLGFDYLTVSDHVLAADATGWTAAGHATPRDDEVYREPLVLLSFIAACTRRLGLETSIMILPQRQTVLVAKQAAELYLLSNGRLRLGAGIGMIELEYRALGQDFHSRGRRLEEQLQLLRMLWTDPSPVFAGRWDSLKGGGLNPLPLQRPIPIWLGGGAGRRGIQENALRRVARLADGWCPLPGPKQIMDQALAQLRGYLVEAGRDPRTFPVEMRTTAAQGTPDAWAAALRDEQARGTTHYTVDNRQGRFQGVAQHLDALCRWRDAVTAG